MSDIEPKIVSILKNDTAISAIVSGRIYLLRLPQSEVLPSIVYFTVSMPEEDDLDGYADIEYPRVQVDCYETTHDRLRTLKNAVKNALRSTEYFSAKCENDFDNDILIDVKNLRYRRTLDFTIHNSE